MKNSIFLVLGLLFVAGFAQLSDDRVCGASPVKNVTLSNPADLQYLYESNRFLTFDLLRILGNSSNVVFGSYSLRRQLSILALGANGTTQTEIIDFINTPNISISDLPLAYWLYNSDRVNVINLTNGSYVYSLASAPFVAVGGNVSQSWLDLMNKYYSICLYQLDFTSDLDTLTDGINNWVSGITQLQNFIDVTFLQEYKDFFWLSGASFTYEWLNPFYPSDTVTKPFNLLNGTQAQIDFLHNPDESLLYLRMDNYVMIRKYFMYGNYSISFILPDIGSFEVVRDSFEASDFFANLLNMTMTDVEFFLPKINFESRLSLKSAFESLGMNTSFVQGEADFSGVETNGTLFLDDIFHGARIIFDELGSTAQPIGTVAPNRTLASNITQLSFDRPFIFIVHDDNIIDFTGQIISP